MVCRYLVMREHMTGICMRQWSALEKQALNLILINVLLRPNVAVSFGNLYFPEGQIQSRYNQTDAATNKQTAAQFFPRYGNLFIPIYAKYFFFDITFERFA